MFTALTFNCYRMPPVHRPKRGRGRPKGQLRPSSSRAVPSRRSTRATATAQATLQAEQQDADDRLQQTIAGQLETARQQDAALANLRQQQDTASDTTAVQNNEHMAQQPTLASLAGVESAITANIAAAMGQHIKQAVQQELAKLLVTQDQLAGDPPFTVGGHIMAASTSQGSPHWYGGHLPGPSSLQQQPANPPGGEVSGQPGHSHSVGGPGRDLPLYQHNASLQQPPAHSGGGHGPTLTVLAQSTGTTGPASQSGFTGGGHGPTLDFPTVRPTASGGVGAGQGPVLAPLSHQQEACKFVGGIGELAPLSAPLPLDYAVSKEIKGKIWANEFIEFGDLLHPSQSTQTKVVVHQDTNGNLGFMQGGKKKPRNIEEWTSAFAIFSTVYASKFPAEVGQLMKYGENVRMIAAEFGNFNYYDSNFRKLRQQIVLPWAMFHTELYMKAMRPSSLGREPSHSGPSQGRKRGASQSQFPLGYCNKYHSGQPCDPAGCTYKHRCFRCQGPHQIFRCWPRAGGSDRQDNERQANNGYSNGGSPGYNGRGRGYRGGYRPTNQSRGRGGGRGQARYQQQSHYPY